jgi:predicted permease
VDLLAMTTMSLPLRAEAPPSPVRLVSGSYFSVLRVPLVAGRPLAPPDDTPANSAVTVISHGLWQRQFGGALDAVGAGLSIGGVPFTVVGVAGPGAIDSPWEPTPDAWIPLLARPLVPGVEPSHRALLEDPRGCCVEIAGRLTDGADMRSAGAELNLLAGQFAAHHRIAPLEISVKSTAWVNDPMAQRIVPTWLILSLAVALTLLLGCANIGNLQLARGLSRRREVALRRAIGATRGRLVRQLLAEGLVLSVAGAALSLLVARYLPTLVLPAGVPPVSLARATFLFAFALALSVCLASSLLPALKTTRSSLHVHEAGASRPRLRSALLGLQVAISTILLAGTGLLARGVYHAAGAGLGFDPSGVAVVSLGLPLQGQTPAVRQERSRRVIESVAQAGLGPFAGTQSHPFGGYRTSSVRPATEGDTRTYSAVTHQVTPGYFEILGIPLIAGRPFEGDRPSDGVVINQSLARLLWPGEPAAAVGRVFLDSETERRVVGVVADARTELVERVWPAYYQGSGSFSAVLVRNDPAAIAIVQDIVHRLEPGASPAVVNVTRRIREKLAASIAGAAIAAALGLLSLLLASVGTLGVFSYVVSERTREIGVRMALGARPRDIVRLLTARMSWPLVGGLVVGLTVAQAMGGLIRGYLHGISPHDPAAYAAVLVVLVAAAVVATVIPIRRAVSVDPAITLRHD